MPDSTSRARTLMVQGTGSSVGKSLLVAALCRIFRQQGIDVAPFKSQNMALNSAVTPEGLEIGRAQAVQAEAAGLAPSVDMNPILLKPEGHQTSQVVLLGRPALRLSAREYHEHKPRLQGVIAESLERLRRRHQLVIIEGAGSPAEINLKARDIVNMHVARLADAPVLLVGDIDRGGVFAALLGTLELLEPEERERVAALVINKFRGDVSLLEPGLEFLRQRTGKPVLGVVPHVPRLRIADEDSVALEGRRAPHPGAPLALRVLRLPHLSNHDDVLALEHEPAVALRFVDDAAELRGADLLIVPGSKSTILDLHWLRARGLAAEITRHAARGGLVLGICGGCQMLGQWIEDPERIESPEPCVPGLGLLGISTRFGREKRTTLVEAEPLAPSFLGGSFLTGQGAPLLSAYEIHMGRLSLQGSTRSPFRLRSRNGQALCEPEGALSPGGNVLGTMLHGLFENHALRQQLLSELRALRGLSPPAAAEPIASREAEYDRLAGAVRAALDMQQLMQIVGC
jgi:adenosylcobyric acid synthase